MTPEARKKAIATRNRRKSNFYRSIQRRFREIYSERTASGCRPIIEDVLDILEKEYGRGPETLRKILKE